MFIPARRKWLRKKLEEKSQNTVPLDYFFRSLIIHIQYAMKHILFNEKKMWKKRALGVTFGYTYRSGEICLHQKRILQLLAHYFYQ